MQTAQQETFDFLEAANDNSNEDAAMKAFNQYHKDNPHVYDLVVQYAKQAIDAGYDHYSIVTIANRIRWHTEIETRGDRFKIINTIRAGMLASFMTITHNTLAFSEPV